MRLRAAGVVLTAGASRRMGTPKAGLVYAGRTFLAHAIAALQDGGVHDVVVVAGHAEQAVADALPPGATISLVRNPEPERGQLSSLQVALEHVIATLPGTEAIVMTLVDHPAIRAATVIALLDAANDPERTPIVVPTHAGRRGHPVLFGRAVWHELLATPDELGARAVVRADPERVRVVPVDDPGILVDVDTPEDLARLLGAEGTATR